MSFIAFSGQRRDPSNVQIMGGFDYWVNTSGDIADNTSWSIANSYYHLPFGSGQGFSHTSSGTYNQRWGDGSFVYISADASKIAWGYQPPNSSEQSGKSCIYIVERNSSNGALTDYHSFNPYDMISTTMKGNRKSFNWGSYFAPTTDFSDNMDRCALAWPVDKPTIGIGAGSHGTVFYARDASTNVWSVEQEFFHGDYPSSSAVGSYGKPSRTFMGNQDTRAGIHSNTDFSKVVMANGYGNDGGIVTFMRSSSTWTTPQSATQWKNPDGNGYSGDGWGTLVSMSRDGNYLATKGNANTSSDTESIYVYQWNSSNTSWDSFDSWQIKNDGATVTFITGMSTQILSMSEMGNI